MIPEHILNEYPEFESNRLPPLLREAMKTYGVNEWLGAGSNPIILGWAGVLADRGFPEFRSYTADGMPWCALWMSWTAYRAGYPLPHAPGWSQAWKKFGGPVEGPEAGEPGDVAVFTRPDPTGHLPPGSLGHVAVVVRAEPHVLHVIGGNQHTDKGDSVNIKRFSRANLVALRAPILPIQKTGAVAA